MAGQSQAFGLGGNIPKTNAIVRASADHHLVSAKDERFDLSPAIGQGRHFLPRVGIPDAEPTVVPARCRLTAVGGKGDGTNALPVPASSVIARTCRHSQTMPPIPTSRCQKRPFGEMAGPRFQRGERAETKHRTRVRIELAHLAIEPTRDQSRVGPITQGSESDGRCRRACAAIGPIRDSKSSRNDRRPPRRVVGWWG